MSRQPQVTSKRNSIGIVLRSWAVHRNALVISAIAGTLLNCINQLPDFMDGQPLNVAKLLLTYLVPYSVSMCSAWLLLRKKEERAG